METLPEKQKTGERKGFSGIQVTQDVISAIMAAIIMSSGAGIFWLIAALPSRLNQIEQQMTQILKNQDAFGSRFMELEKTVNDFDRRIIKLELNK